MRNGTKAVLIMSGLALLLSGVALGGADSSCSV